jgi:hypothetical protein
MPRPRLGPHAARLGLARAAPGGAWRLADGARAHPRGRHPWRERGGGRGLGYGAAWRGVAATNIPRPPVVRRISRAEGQQIDPVEARAPGRARRRKPGYVAPAGAR